MSKSGSNESIRSVGFKNKKIVTLAPFSQLRKTLIFESDTFYGLFRKWSRQTDSKMSWEIEAAKIMSPSPKNTWHELLNYKILPLRHHFINWFQSILYKTIIHLAPRDLSNFNLRFPSPSVKFSKSATRPCNNMGTASWNIRNLISLFD
jgi:hypothetical protein